MMLMEDQYTLTLKPNSSNSKYGVLQGMMLGTNQYTVGNKRTHRLASNSSNKCGV